MTTFIPVTIAATAAPVADDVQIEVRRGAMAVNVAWPSGASAQCAGWLRELLK